MNHQITAVPFPCASGKGLSQKLIYAVVQHAKSIFENQEITIAYHSRGKSRQLQHILRIL